MPGPTDREHFFAAQLRNRRATWRLTALCLLGGVLLGLAMSEVISPIVGAAIVILNDLLNLVVPTPDLYYLLAHADQNPAVSGGQARTRPKKRSTRLTTSSPRASR
ncbi:MAG: hypothetical protein ACREVJ_15530 [Gammaproteobacteria bacterium]